MTTQPNQPAYPSHVWRCDECEHVFENPDGRQHHDGDVEVWCPKCRASDEHWRQYDSLDHPEGQPSILEKEIAALQAQVEAAKGAVEALESVVEAGQYIVEITHYAADPKNMNTTDWKGIALHMYAAMNVLPAARICLVLCAAAGLTNNQTMK